jgi:hypothetical protein
MVNENKPTSSILQKAEAIVNNDRAKDYGHVLPQFERTAKLWSALLDVTVTPEQVIQCMIALKQSRQLYRFKEDNLIDIAGYAYLLQKIEIERKCKSE